MQVSDEVILYILERL